MSEEVEISRSDMCPGITKICMNQVVRSSHVDKSNNLDGGQLLKWVDICACLSAERLAAHPCVTVSVDDLYFEKRVGLGDVLSLKAKINRVFNTSMEVGVTAFCESVRDGKQELVCKAYITFVALDLHGKKVKLPPLECRSEKQHVRHALASERRKVRISHSKNVQKLLDHYLTDSDPPAPQASPTKNQNADDDDVFKSPPSDLPVVSGQHTSIESVELVLPSHANHHGNTFGGQIMAWMENNASISAGRYFSCDSMLKSVDMVHFRGPSNVGDRVVICSQVNNVFQNSLEVGVRVEAYTYHEGVIGKRRHINSAFFTYDSLQEHQRYPLFVPLPGEGERRMREASARRKLRFDRRYSLASAATSPLHARNVLMTATSAVMLCCANVSAFSELSAHTTTGWTVISSIGQTELATRDSAATLSFRVTLDLASPSRDRLPDAARVFAVLRDPVRRALWDETVVQARRLPSDQLLLPSAADDGDDALYHVIVRSPEREEDDEGEESNNDFVLLVSSRKPQSANDGYKVAMRSVVTNSMPELAQYKRTTATCSGFLLRANHLNQATQIVYYNTTNAQIASYITRDMAGLSKKYHTVMTKLLAYLDTHISDKS